MDPWRALRLQLEWGVDECLDDQPVDRRQPTDRRRPVATGATQPQLSTRTAAGASAETPAAIPVLRVAARAGAGATSVDRAIAAAAAATSIEALATAFANFTECPLRDTATHFIFTAGSPHAPAWIVGEAPGADEDRAGHGFAGRTGDLLDQMLAGIALTREQVLLADMVPWRPPGGRDPTPRETAMCQPFLRRLIVLGRPRVIVLLGSRVAAAVTGDRLTTRRMAKPLAVAVDGFAEPVTAIPIPTLEQVASGGTARRAAWQGLRALRRTIDGQITQKPREV